MRCVERDVPESRPLFPRLAADDVISLALLQFYGKRLGNGLDLRPPSDGWVSPRADQRSFLLEGRACRLQFMVRTRSASNILHWSIAFLFRLVSRSIKHRAVSLVRVAHLYWLQQPNDPRYLVPSGRNLACICNPGSQRVAGIEKHFSPFACTYLGARLQTKLGWTPPPTSAVALQGTRTCTKNFAIPITTIGLLPVGLSGTWI
jgi:hypothetical protein